ncbi:MAG: hypothetical protein WDW38_006196 [Sanguina aurantia]
MLRPQVNIGSLLDPVGLDGLAHFTEHMLFYSSAKYPVEDEYSKYVSDHGGHTNAWTASENTNYQFDVNWDALEPTLDRFAQFFISPAISADGVDREVKAVDSEHGKNLATDAWRQLQLYKHTANPAHPWARFATGNLETLGAAPRAAGVDVRDASLDEMEGWVRAMFSAVPNKDLPIPSFSPGVFLPSQVGTLLRMVPVRDVQSLELAWQVPPSQPQYKQAPLSVLSHLLGHEGTGSLFSLLKSLGWASSLVAGESGSSMSCASFFYISVELTLEGYEHVQEVGAAIFSYLALLQRDGIPRSVYDELVALQRLRFEFRDKPSPYAYASGLAGCMQVHGDEDLLLGMYHVPQIYDPEAISASLQRLTLDGVRACWVSKELLPEATSSEPWYGTNYSLSPLPQEWLDAWAAAGIDGRLHLPEPNPFVPTDFRLHAAEPSVAQAHPNLLVHIPGSLSLHHKTDLTFTTPKAVIYLDFQTPEAYASPTAAVLTRLYVKLLLDYLNEMAYPAELAGLTYSVSNTQTGFQLTLTGYSHRIGVLTEAILQRMLGFKVLEDRFACVREAAHKEYQNVKYQQPYQYAMYRRELLLNAKRWSIDEYLLVVMGLTAADLTSFVPRLFKMVHLEALVVGNIKAEEAAALGKHIIASLAKELGTLPVPASLAKEFRVMKVPVGSGSVLDEAGPNPSNDNSAVVVAFQAGPDELRLNALCQLLVQMSKREAFHALRTVEQLGYIVSLFNNHEHLVHTIEFVLQSNVHSAAHLASRVDVFVEGLVSTLLPTKCNIAPTAPSESATPPSVTATTCQNSDSAAEAESEAQADPPVCTSPPPPSVTSESAAAAAADAGVEGLPDVSDGVSEFATAVEELIKDKLEKPKRLNQLASRWWNELFYGTHMYDRQEREVATLKTLQPADLLEFATQTLLQPSTCRKVTVQVRGTAEAKPAVASADLAADAPADEAKSDAETLKVEAAAEEVKEFEVQQSIVEVTAVQATQAGQQYVKDILMWKRGCEMWPNVAAASKLAVVSL